MPIEIKELNISISVGQPGGQTNTTATQGAKQEDNKKTLEECVEQVMKIINDKNER